MNNVNIVPGNMQIQTCDEDSTNLPSKRTHKQASSLSDSDNSIQQPLKRQQIISNKDFKAKHDRVLECIKSMPETMTLNTVYAKVSKFCSKNELKDILRFFQEGDILFCSSDSEEILLL